MTEQKSVTIEDLASMIKKGFEEQTNNLNEFRNEMYSFISWQ